MGGGWKCFNDAYIYMVVQNINLKGPYQSVDLSLAVMINGIAFLSHVSNNDKFMKDEVGWVESSVCDGSKLTICGPSGPKKK